MAIRAVPVEGPVAAGQGRALHHRDAMHQEPGADVARLRRQAGRQRVGVDVPLLARHAGEGEATCLRAEVVALDVVDEDHVSIPELGRPRHRHGVDGLGPRGQGQPELQA